MRVIVGCEFSGVVRDAFIRRGHDAWSCDMLPCESPIQDRHYQMDAIRLIETFPTGYWDLMIAHPPCTYMANSGAKHLYLGMKKENGPNPERWQNMRAGAEFFKALWNSGIPKIAMENPIMLGCAQEIIGAKPDQVIQPWMFGHGEIKATCLWLKDLPKLTPTDIVEGRTARVHLMPPSPNRWKERSRTLKGIAEAMAGQWGGPQCR